MYLLPHCSKTYFVFTDATYIFHEDKPNVKKIEQKNLGWPGGTIMRFEMFRRIENILKNYDFLFFFNSDMQLIDFVWEEILPFEEELTALVHPLFYDKRNTDYPYERNPNSMAYIPFGLGTNYYFGSLYGGKANDFLNMSKTLDETIANDISNGVIAIWYDESYLNRYLLTLKYIKSLDPSYGYPEGCSLPFVPKIIKRDKSQWGGHQSFRSIYG